MMDEKMKTVAQVSNRIEWIDNAKGLGIILVIMGHISISSVPVRIWLYTFHMPLFFFLSGCTFNYKKYQKLSQLIKSRIKTLLIPYLIFAILNLSIGIIKMSLFHETYDWFRRMIGTFVSVRGTIYSNGPWFLTCLFSVEVIAWIIIRLTRNKKNAILFYSIGCLFAGYLYISYIGVLTPWAIETALIAIMFFEIGYCYGRYIEKIKNFYIGIIAINIIIGASNYILSSEQVDMYSNSYGNIVLFIIAALSGIVFMCAISKKIKIKIISIIGKNSLYFFAMHFYVIDIINCCTEQLMVGVYNDMVRAIINLCLTLICVLVMFPFLNIYKLVIKKVTALFYI